MLRTIFLCTFVVFFFQVSVAQQAPSVIPPSPQAAALGKFGDLPVGEYTGTISPSIPLYELTVRDITVPITADYHSSGVRVAEDASWIGLGWALNAGGMITRTVMGKNDLLVAETNAGSGYTGFPFTSSLVNCNSDNLPNILCPPPDPDYLNNACLGFVDTEPDIFYFNFLGHSGKFILRQRDRDFGSPISIPDYPSNIIDGIMLSEEKMRILFDISLKQWEITTDEGTKFYFSVPEKTEIWYGNGLTPGDADGSMQFYNSNTDFLTQSWYLTKIVSSTGNTVNFLYDVDQNGRTLYGSRSPMDRSESTTRLTKVIYEGGCSFSFSPITWSSTARFYSHVYLNRITFDGGFIDFKKSDRSDVLPATGFNSYNAPNVAQKLDRIEVNSANKLMKRINFSYDYFNSSYSGTNPALYKRLKLVSIQEDNLDPSIQTTLSKGPHVFTYDETKPLPSKESMSQDFWGYSNGAANTGLVPAGSNVNALSFYQFTSSGADREAHFDYTKSGVLTSIKYPTGGSTDFEYELNDFSDWGHALVNYTTINDPVLKPTWTFTASNSESTTKIFKTDQVVSVTLSRSLLCWPPYETPPACSANGNESFVYAKLTQLNTNGGAETVLRSYLLGTDWITNRSNTSTNPFIASETIILQPGIYRLVVEETGSFKMSLTASYQSTVDALLATGTLVKPYARFGGGLRIRRVVQHDGISSANDQVTRYQYTKELNGGVVSSGKLMMEPNCFIEATIESIFNDQCPFKYFAVVGNSAGVFPMGSSAQGNFVGYDQVTVLNGDNGEFGRTMKTFNNQVELVPNGTFLLMGVPNSTFSNSNGQVLQEDDYDRNGFLVKSVGTVYAFARQKRVKGLKFLNYGKALLIVETSDPNGAGGVFDACYKGSMVSAYYDVLSEFWYPYITTERIYDLNDATNQTYSETVTTETFNISTHLQKAAEQVVDSKGHTQVTNYVYPGDASDPDRTAHPQMWDETNSNFKYIYSPVIRRQVTDNSKLIYDEVNSYSYDASRDKILNTAKSIAPNGTVLENRLSMTYDNNPSVLVEVSRSDDKKTSFIWGYFNTRPVARIENASYAQVKQLLTSSDLSELSGLPTDAQVNAIAAKLRASLPQAMITSYTHDLLNGVSSVTDPNGKTTSYSYDVLQRLIQIKDFEGQIIKEFKYNYKN